MKLKPYQRRMNLVYLGTREDIIENRRTGPPSKNKKVNSKVSRSKKKNAFPRGKDKGND
jgi:hypothetical protein